MDILEEGPLGNIPGRGCESVMLSEGPSVEERIEECIDAGFDISTGCINLTVLFEKQNPIFRRELERCNIPDFDSILVPQRNPPNICCATQLTPSPWAP